MRGTLQLAVRMARGHARRHLLTLVTLALGLAGLVTIAAAATTMSRTVEYNEMLLHGRSTTVTIALKPIASATDIDRVTKQALAVSGGGTLAAPFVRSSVMTVTDPADLSGTQLILTDHNLATLRGWPVLDGSWLSTSRDQQPTAVGNRVAAAHGARPGDVVRVTGGGAVVIRGTIDDGQSDPNLYLRLDQYSPLRLFTDAFAASVMVSGPGLDASELDQRLTLIEDLSRIAPIDSITQSDTLASLQRQRTATAVVFSIVAIFSALSLAIGIINIGLATSRERALELSLRRALGFSRPRLAVAIVIESQLVAIMAAVLAAGVAAAIFPWLLSQLTTLPGAQGAPYSVEASFFGLAIGVAACLVGSCAPVVNMWRMPMSIVMRQ